MTYDTLDPGIRDTVKLLNDAGFVTTDSGDGVSKPADWYESGDALPYPHVACAVSRAAMLDEADRLQQVLGRTWRVEASYAPIDASYLLFAYQSGRSHGEV
jgi:hypothetical protein